MKNLIVKRVLNSQEKANYDVLLTFEATNKKFYQIEVTRSILDDIADRKLVANVYGKPADTVCLSIRTVKNWYGVAKTYYYTKYNRSSARAIRRWNVYELKEMNESDLLEVML